MAMSFLMPPGHPRTQASVLPRAVGAIGTLALFLAAAQCRAACPVDPSAAASVLLSIQFESDAPLRIASPEFAAFAQRRLTQRRTISSADANGASSMEQATQYGGVLLRDVIAGAPGYQTAGAAQRGLVFQAVAIDGYRAIFSWGELFNSDATEQVLVIQSQGGQPLDNAEGPLALRALGDLKPGPRHVRNLCAIIVSKLGAALK